MDTVIPTTQSSSDTDLN